MTDAASTARNLRELVEWPRNRCPQCGTVHLQLVSAANDAAKLLGHGTSMATEALLRNAMLACGEERILDDDTQPKICYNKGIDACIDALKRLAIQLERKNESDV